MLLLPAYSYTVVEITTNKGDNQMYNNYNITTRYLDCDESFSFEQNNDWEYDQEEDYERNYDAKEDRHKDSDRKEGCKKHRDKKEGKKEDREKERDKKPPLKPHERPMVTDKEVLATGNVFATGSVYQLYGNQGTTASPYSTDTEFMSNYSNELMGNYAADTMNNYTSDTDTYSTTSCGYSNQGYSTQEYSNQGYSTQEYSNQGYSNQGYSNQEYSNQGYSNQGYSNCQCRQNCCWRTRCAFQQGLREGFRRGCCACRRQNRCRCCCRNNTFGNGFWF